MTPSANKMHSPLARSLMFWLGAAFLVIAIHGMTPYTYQIDDIKITLVHILGPILIVAYLVLLALGHIVPPRMSIMIPLVLYFAVMIASTLAAKPFAKWVGWQTILQQWALLGPFLAFMVGCSDTRGARRGLALFTILLMDSVVFGLAHRLGIATLIYNYYDSVGYDTRNPSFIVKMARTFIQGESEMMSIILNRDFYGCFLALTIPMAIGCLLLGRNRIWHAAVAITLPFAGICLLLTNSKDSWVVTAAGVAIVIFLYLFAARLKVRYRKQLMAVLIGFLAIVAAVAIITRGNLLAQAKTFAMSFNSRAVLWGGAIDIWKNSPILGEAPGAYRIFLPNYRRPDYFLYDISHVTISAHNYFLDLFCDTGILGFLTLMSFFGVLYWKNLSHVRGDPSRDQRIISMVLIGGMTGFFLNSITSPAPRWAVGAINLWSALGMMAGAIHVRLTREAMRSEVDESLNEAEESGRRPRIQIAWGWRPAGALRPALWVFAAANAVLAIYATNNGITFFRASMANNRGINLIGDGSRPGQIGQLREMIMQGQANLRLSTGQTVLELHRMMWEEAVGHFEKAVKLAPSMVTCWYKLASLYSTGPDSAPGKDEYEKALTAYDAILKHWPEYSQTPYNLGTMYMALAPQFADSGDLVKAREAVDKARKYLVRASEMTLDPEISETVVQFLLELSMESGPSSLVQMGLEERMANRRQALVIAKRLVDGWERVAKTDVRLARVELERIRRQSARLYATVADISGDKDERVKALLHLHALSPGDNEVIAEIVEAYKSAGNLGDLSLFLAKVLKSNPLNQQVRFFLAATLAGQGKLREAKREALALQKIDAKSGDSDYLLFLIYASLGSRPQATSYANAFLQKAGGSERAPGVRSYLAQEDAPAPASR